MSGFPCKRDPAATTWTEREELVARFTDLCMEKEEAEMWLRVHAERVDEGRDARKKLRVSARAYRDAEKALADLKRDVPLDVLYSDLVLGEAISDAEEVRRARLHGEALIRLPREVRP